jgi:hypothetical protein
MKEILSEMAIMFLTLSEKINKIPKPKITITIKISINKMIAKLKSNHPKMVSLILTLLKVTLIITLF